MIHLHMWQRSNLWYCMNLQKLMEVTKDGEQWEQISKYPNYYVSSEGRVYSDYEKRILKGEYNSRGYHLVELHNDQTPKGKHGKKYRVSHLVAAAFCSKYAKGKHVHHINRKRSDDRAVNLLPCTPEEHRTIHALYNTLFGNIPLLAELLTPVIHININLLFDDMKGGDVA